MPRIVVISGSPSQSAKTSIVAEYMCDLMYGNRWRTNVIKVRDLPPEALMYTQFDNPAIVSSVENLEQADGGLSPFAYAGLRTKIRSVCTGCSKRPQRSFSPGYVDWKLFRKVILLEPFRLWSLGCDIL